MIEDKPLKLISKKIIECLHYHYPESFTKSHFHVYYKNTEPEPVEYLLIPRENPDSNPEKQESFTKPHFHVTEPVEYLMLPPENPDSNPPHF